MVDATNGLMTIVVGNSERCQISFGYCSPRLVTGRMGDDTLVKKSPIGGGRVRPDGRGGWCRPTDPMKERRLGSFIGSVTPRVTPQCQDAQMA